MGAIEGDASEQIAQSWSNSTICKVLDITGLVPESQNNTKRKWQSEVKKKNHILDGIGHEIVRTAERWKCDDPANY
ncbi:hypothetical protein FOXB_06270 [Fusarium oxysporum f. sp. conglutinans Fo5176]|uniref:Uncharacterized protein n=1 Tax=Fusarium oxysporum (strain Fo5176) TaxID=660025 RepID=F9FIP1_FUSOF|nr:hypothetical protein FOXB_06270 [Fusarium oxysporum f. sp. conglutinans Fo5176]